MLERIREVTHDVAVGLVVFNAGASHGTGPFVAASLDAVTRAIRMGASGVATLAHFYGAQMAERGRGGIVLMGSLAGNAGAPGFVLYSALKAFGQLLAEGLWTELKPRNVDVLYAVLGAVRTPSRTRAGFKDDSGAADPDDVARECLDNIANGPVLVPAQLAEAFQTFSSLPRRQAAQTMTNMLRGFKAE
jgi:short-subunit dehydrogenase